MVHVEGYDIGDEVYSFAYVAVAYEQKNIVGWRYLIVTRCTNLQTATHTVRTQRFAGMTSAKAAFRHCRCVCEKDQTLSNEGCTSERRGRSSISGSKRRRLKRQAIILLAKFSP